MSKEKRELKEKEHEAHVKEKHVKPVEDITEQDDPAAAAFQEALAKAQSEFDAASSIGDKKIISNAAQRLYDIKEQERVRLSNLRGPAERLVDTDPQSD